MKKNSNTENHFETQKIILWEIWNFTPSSAALAVAPQAASIKKEMACNTMKERLPCNIRNS
jgi:hypothetical protein